MTFRIGRNFHIIHMTDDLRALDAWYYEVFSVRRFLPAHYSPAEQRDASLVLIGDLCIETLAPAFHAEGWDAMPLGRFFTRHGRRFHSIAWYVDEGMAELHDALLAAGFDCRGTGGVRLSGGYKDGSPVFTNPKDTLTQLEFIPAPDAPGGPALLGDPRYQPGWQPSWWADYHPLQIQKLSHVTVSTFDLSRALEVYAGTLGGTLVHEADNPVHRSRSAFVQVGDDVLVELAQPAGEGPLQADMARFHHGIYAVTFKVRDLDDAAAHLDRCGVAYARADEGTIVSDPDTTQGCVMAFTDRDVPGDRRPDWTAVAGDAVPARVFLGT
ncbi:MAG TPA: VOC family protein [Acidimicrobiales bacterium]|nr:VOC family protein [Acidimicrobiales bacterium]